MSDNAIEPMDAARTNDAILATPWETIAPLSAGQREPEIPAGEIDEDDEPSQKRNIGGGALTIPLICIGICLIACCLLIPAADANRRVAYEKQRLTLDLDQLQKQVATNEAFLKRVASDQTLAERLARRQMRMIPQGTSVLELKSQHRSQSDLSPFLLVTVPPPAPMPPYHPLGGVLSQWCLDSHAQLYLIGAALMSIATGLVMSQSQKRIAPTKTSLI